MQKSRKEMCKTVCKKAARKNLARYYVRKLASNKERKVAREKAKNYAGKAERNDTKTNARKIPKN